ncbi:MAG: RNA polymerase sigma factor [Planctomycetota bacterium]
MVVVRGRCAGHASGCGPLAAIGSAPIVPCTARIARAPMHEPAANIPANVDLVALCASHRAGLRHFLEVHTPRWLRCRESVADLEQTIWRQVLVTAAALEDRGESRLREWLLTTARNKLIDRVRFHRRECRDVRREYRSAESGGGISTVEPRDAWSSSRVLAGREELERFERALVELADDERNVIVMCRMERMSAAEAGEVLGRGEGATRALLSRALARLSSRLATGTALGEA